MSTRHSAGSPPRLVRARRGSGGLLRRLLERATRDEQDFLVRLLFGELRQGALEGVLVEAVARASEIRRCTSGARR